MSSPTVAQIRPLSARPTPAEVAEFSRAVRSALLGLQVVPGQLAQLQRQLTGVAAVAGAGAVVEAPTLPTGFTATGLFSGIQLTWAPPGYEGHAYTEIWRAQVDDLGQAVQVDREAFLLWTDTALPSSALAERYYYWIRHVNDNGDAGAFNATAGTAASTVDDPEYLLEIATEKWLPVNNYALGALTIPTRPNGFCYEVTIDGGSSGAVEPAWPVVIDQTVADGGLVWTCKAAFSFESFFKVALVDGQPRLALKQLFLADGIIKRAMIQALAVDDAKIDNLNVSKLLAGVIAASNIFLGAESRVHLDGQNNRLVVTDANSVTRVVLGKLAVGYGIEIYDAAGALILGSGGVPLSKVSGAGALAGLNSLTYSALTGTKPPTDADKTSANIAAGIAGQGAFATIDTINPSNVALRLNGALMLNGQKISHFQVGSVWIPAYSGGVPGKATITHNLGRRVITNVWVTGGTLSVQVEESENNYFVIYSYASIGRTCSYVYL